MGRSDTDTVQKRNTRTRNRRSSNLLHPVAISPSNELVVPAEAEDGVDLDCPDQDCTDSLRARGPFVDGTVRHFFHPGGKNCSGTGGESEQHRLACSHAASALGIFYADLICETSAADRFRVHLDVLDTDTDVDRREADALVTFREEMQGPPFGKGIIVEVQHKHHQKDIEATTADYHSCGYSVAWMSATDDFTDAGFAFDQEELQSRLRPVWPSGIPDERWRTPGDRPLAEAQAMCSSPSLSVPLPKEYLVELYPALKTAWRSALGHPATSSHPAPITAALAEARDLCSSRPPLTVSLPKDYPQYLHRLLTEGRECTRREWCDGPDSDKIVCIRCSEIRRQGSDVSI